MRAITSSAMASLLMTRLETWSGMGFKFACWSGSNRLHRHVCPTRMVRTGGTVLPGRRLRGMALHGGCRGQAASLRDGGLHGSLSVI